MSSPDGSIANLTVTRKTLDAPNSEKLNGRANRAGFLARAMETRRSRESFKKE
jgi:hypothetical protein